MYSIFSSICFCSVNSFPSRGEWIRWDRQAGDGAEGEAGGDDPVERSCITESAIGLWFEEKLLPSPCSLRVALPPKFSFPPWLGSLRAGGVTECPQYTAVGSGAASLSAFALWAGPTSRELELGNPWRRLQLSAESFPQAGIQEVPRKEAEVVPIRLGREVNNLTFFDSDLWAPVKWVNSYLPKKKQPCQTVHHHLFFCFLFFLTNVNKFWV